MKRLLLFIILLLSLFYLSSKYYFNTGLILKEYNIKSENISSGFNGFKITHFTDLLLDDKVNINKVSFLVDSINENKSDIIVFTGDLLKTSINDDIKQELINNLSKIECRYNKYAILGDHDTLDSKDILEQSNFIILDNTYDLLYQNDITPIIIIGGNKLEDLEIEDIDYGYSIVLIHKPDYFDTIKDKEYNLILAGHSLGGQIRLPFMGALLKKNGSSTYTNDYYKEKNTIMYVSYGIGNEKYDLRFLNKPSYNLYRLYTK